jgi:hypothetical protein
MITLTTPLNPISCRAPMTYERKNTNQIKELDVHDFE